ncbi:MAG: hypothetical protein K6G13_05180 [Agathobacter sp.]|uniref:hypothetical protein n=1 Tax=Agathobacter sp. TaxID=2021311 RepID=UPI0025895E3E|nr:hypothetical protein [Agathobacter sp.]MCR5677405.1 hypothetical protein [Agathobacter sp.]
MTENETQSHYRVISFLIIILSMVALTSLLSFVEKLGLDLWICNYVIDLMFFLAIVFEMEFERKRAKIAQNIETTFLRIATGFGICSIFAAAMFFLPHFVRPVLLFPIIMYGVCNTVISISTSMYFIYMLCLLSSSNIYEFGLYVLLVVVGLAWVRALEETQYHLEVCILLSLIGLLLPVLFSYFDSHTLELQRLLYSAINSVLVFVLSFFLFRRLRNGTIEEVQNRLTDILADSYSEVIELRLYSKSEYLHAITVSKICFECAKKLGLKADLCAAAGFYYRIGKWKGEPHVETGVFYAKKLCFPTELIQIIAEYYGEKEPLSTKEAALVHIVDATVKKLQVLQSQATASGWNKELLIYQTLNDFSQSGIYDRSGLSMNQFLQIREMLVKEEKINELLSGDGVSD